MADPQAFFSTPTGREVQVHRNYFRERLRLACAAVPNVLLGDDDLYHTDNKQDAVEFLNIIVNRVWPTFLDYCFSKCTTKRKILFERMVPTKNPIVFNVVQVMFILFPFKMIYETLLLEVFRESHAVYYIDTAGRKYTGMDQFEKHNTLFYGTMCYGRRVVKVNLLQSVLHILDFIAWSTYVYLLISLINVLGEPDSLVGVGLGFLNIYLTVRNVQEYYDKRRFGEYRRSFDRFVNLGHIVSHLITYTSTSVPITFSNLRNIYPTLVYVLLVNFMFLPIWIYHQLGLHFEGFWRIPMLPRVSRPPR